MRQSIPKRKLWICTYIKIVSKDPETNVFDRYSPGNIVLHKVFEYLTTYNITFKMAEDNELKEDHVGIT